MKIRSGFVSNSSSSSFILGLTRIPETTDDLKLMLNIGDYPVIDGSYECLPTDMVINTIYNDIMEVITNNKHVSNLKDMLLVNDFSNEIRYNIKDYDHYISRDNILRYNELKTLTEYYNKEEDKVWAIKDNDVRRKKLNELREKFNSCVEEISHMIIDTIMKDKKDRKIFFELVYSDNDGALGSLIEHGNVLDPIEILYFSHH